MKHLSRSSYLFVVASLFMALVIAACGGGGGGSSATAIPTFTQIPTYNFVQPTIVPVIETAVATIEGAATAEAEATNEAAATSEATATAEAESTTEAVATSEAASTSEAAAVVLDAEMVTRGKGRYDALKCGDCHGANGEGTDKGSSLITSTLNEGDFIAFLRSGGKLGAAHQFATNRLSISGGAALYQYILSLRNAS